MLKQVGAVGGAVAIAACWPFATGQIGESIYMDTVGQYENPYLIVSNQSYDRGYLSSAVVSRIEIKDEFKTAFEEEGVPTTWLIEHKVDHGFAGVTTSSTLQITPEIKSFVEQFWSADIAPVTFTTSTFVTRKTDFALTVNPAKYDSGDAKVDMQAFTMTGTADLKGAGEFRYTWPQARFETVAGESMLIEGLSGSGKGTMDGHFWIGSQSLTLDSISIVNQEIAAEAKLETIALSMSNTLTALSETDSEHELANANSITVSKITSPTGEEYSDFNLDMNISKVSFDALSRLATQADDFGEQITEAQSKEIELALDLLIAKGVQFDLSDLSINTPKGMISSQLQLKLEPGVARASQDISQVTEKLSGMANLTLPAAIVNENPNLQYKVQMLEEGGMMVLDGDNYKLALTLEGDQIVRPSGERFPAIMLLMLFMQA